MESEKKILTSIVGLLLFFGTGAQSQSAPYGLTLNLLSQPQQVYVNGYPTATELEDAVNQRENYQFTEINRMQPGFGWIVSSEKHNTTQTAFRILVAKD